jgi:type III pantothenate kinase
MPTEDLSEYLCLTIGNSRLHWAYFKDSFLHLRWDSSHCDRLEDIELIVPPNIPKNIPLYLASVVTQQTNIWQDYPLTKIITLADISLDNLYPTLGIDRALAILGAGVKYGFPCLVVDGGTALTFTGVDGDKKLVGGAILAGLQLQFQALSKNTAALPKVNLQSELPNRWALNTEDAIASGIINTIVAGIADFIADWRSKYPNSQVIITGGDSRLIHSYLIDRYFAKNLQLIIDENLIFWGIKFVAIDR